MLVIGLILSIGVLFWVGRSITLLIERKLAHSEQTQNAAQYGEADKNNQQEKNK